MQIAEKAAMDAYQKCYEEMNPVISGWSFDPTLPLSDWPELVKTPEWVKAQIEVGTNLDSDRWKRTVLKDEDIEERQSREDPNDYTQFFLRARSE